MKRVLIANRGEIALRIVRACRRRGVQSIAVYSDADENSPHVWAADEAVRIGPAAASRSYLDAGTILEVAKAMRCDALHPGYGFLSERAAFAADCLAAGIAFVGPPARAIELMGDKAEARRTALKHGVPVVPGSEDAFLDAAAAAVEAKSVGFPILLKARAGGGGRGMRVVKEPEAFVAAFAQATAEAEAAFGDGGVYLERFISRIRHVEVQVFGDTQGRVTHLLERDCSVQRRHQKLIEEGPSPVLDEPTRQAICAAAVKLASAIGYVGAGTVEFIYETETREFYFIEMNTRIQVEHPVTEMLTGTDLVAEQLGVAAGEPLSFPNRPFTPKGHAIELRINAEDPARNFMPSPGRLTCWRPPAMPGVRIDSHAYRGYEVPPFYDSLIGKLIVHGQDRPHCIARARDALDCFEAGGIATTIPFLRKVLAAPAFVNASVHTRWVETEFAGA
ncbi:acetyl-CoA carboxylase biotin carboxylase subunit [Acidiphilium sp. AL]|uniref:acetyl-CoA carboxylase biotin carboxylase subunit n=1 Tax=Acidiphilium sp. AL TaxID=2871704 RepID=UPI0021CB4130|nr:acetyl-CoA carboxylase biotin carboxylase subunit [Acidiphilium sp. AL]MCU4160391.1 acetyl-CoA carboxylase biotin carboxylase subunit [Acidiphilium sp. AL]